MPAEHRRRAAKQKKEHKKSSNKEETTEADQSTTEHVPTGLRWGATIRHALMRMIIIGVLIYVLQAVYTKDLPSLARQDEEIKIRIFDRNCSDDYKEDRKKFKECAPHHCGRGVMDQLVTKAEAQTLLKVARAGLAYGGATGGASILDLNTGALSQGTAFVNIYKLLEEKGITDVFSETDFMVYKSVSTKIRMAIAVQFRIPSTKVYLTGPTFFSKMTNKPAVTQHDEYWHEHIDKFSHWLKKLLFKQSFGHYQMVDLKFPKETYDTFDYTSLLYLSDYNKDFEGGRFVFVDSDDKKTVEPRFGRVSFFTSGSENVHYVEKVTNGTRYAMTVSFTCDPSKAIQTPSMKTS